MLVRCFSSTWGGQTGGGRSGITTGGRVGFALYSGTDIYNGGSSNALGRVTSDSLLRVEYVGGGANTAIVGGSTFGGPDFADFKDGEYYRVTILSDKQFTISYGDSSSTTEFTYNMSDLAGSGGTIQRLAVYNLGANMDALFGPIVVSNASYLNFSNNTAEFKDITGVVGNNGATTNAVVKNGAGTVTFSANNTYGGATTISNGVLNLNTTGGGAAAGATTSVAVHSGATLIISQNEQINNAADVTLSGGTIRRGSGVSETMGNLTLTTASTLDFGTGSTGTLSFGTYTPSSLLTVSNFLEGNVLTFKSDLTSTINNGSLFSISNAFSYNWDGGSSTFTITAIPETSTMVAALGLAGMFLWPARRRPAS